MKIKAMQVYHIEGGCFGGGEESYWDAFRMDDNDENNTLPHPKAFIVINKEDVEKLKQLGVEIDIK